MTGSDKLALLYVHDAAMCDATCIITCTCIACGRRAIIIVMLVARRDTMLLRHMDTLVDRPKSASNEFSDQLGG